MLVSEQLRSPNQSIDNKLRLRLVCIWFTNIRGRIISFKENVLFSIIFFPLQLDYPSQRQQLFSQAIGRITSGINNLHIICVKLESISSWHGLQNTKKHLFWLNKTDASVLVEQNRCIWLVERWFQSPLPVTKPKTKKKKTKWSHSVFNIIKIAPWTLIKCWTVKKINSGLSCAGNTVFLRRSARPLIWNLGWKVGGWGA